MCSCEYSCVQGRIQTEVEGGGQLGEGVLKHDGKLARRRRAEIFGALFERILWFFY